MTADADPSPTPRTRSAPNVGWPLSALVAVLLLAVTARWASVAPAVANVALLASLGLLVVVARQTSHRWPRAVARLGLLGALVVTAATVGATDPVMVRALTNIDTTRAPWDATLSSLSTQPRLPDSCPDVLAHSQPLAAAMARGWKVVCAGNAGLTSPDGIISAAKDQSFGATHLASRTIYLRSSYDSERLALWTAAHEVGHTIDHDLLTPSARQRFLDVTGTTSWTGGPYTARGGEVWAQSYAACTAEPHEWIQDEDLRPAQCGRIWAAL